MPHRVKVVLVLVAVSLGGSALLGVERPPKTVAPVSRRVVRPATPTASVFLQALRNFWAHEGSYIDPFGSPRQSTSTTDSGSYIDPFGGQ